MMHPFVVAWSDNDHPDQTFETHVKASGIHHFPDKGYWVAFDDQMGDEAERRYCSGSVVIGLEHGG